PRGRAELRARDPAAAAGPGPIAVSAGSDSRTPALEELAASLRARLVAERSGGDVHERMREIVRREAGILDQADRDELERLIERGAAGLGPLEPLLADAAGDEVMGNGPRG